MFFDEETKKMMKERKEEADLETEALLKMTEMLSDKNMNMKILNLQIKAISKLHNILDYDPKQITEKEQERIELFFVQINALIDQFMKGESHE